MIRSEPGGPEVDPLKAQFAYQRSVAGRPWVMANFITTIDGAAVVDGGSTAINDPDDKAMFAAIRAVPDFIVVGAGTVRAENYRPIDLDPERQGLRRVAGLESNPHLVVVSGSLSLDPDARVFSDPENRVTILTTTTADADRAEALDEVADVIRLADLSASGILHYLRMARAVLLEGGPSLFGQFVAGGYVDEIAWTIAPMLVAGDSPRMAVGEWAETNQEMNLDRVLYGDRSLFLRYVKKSA